MRTRAAYLTIASLAITVVMLLFGTATVSPVWAQSQKSGENLSNGGYGQKGIESPINAQIKAVNEGKSSTEKFVEGTATSLASHISLVILGAGDQNVSTGATGPYSTSAVAGLTNLIGEMYGNPPANTQTYVAYMLDSTGIVATPAYAQGLGFSALSPILKAWTTFRNLAYLCFVVIFLVIGFMIMFRQKIGSQTAVTAQQALPRMIISLIFVTFSYAIAGLLIDGMYLIMYLLIGVFGFQNQETQVLGGNFLSIGQLLLTGNLFSTAFESVQTFITGSLGDTNATSFVPTLLGDAGGIVAVVVLAIAILFGMFQLFFELLRTYVNIIMSIVIAPISLMMGALPGQNAFGGWLKNLIANLAAFPTILLVLIIFDQITGSITQAGSAGVGNITGGGFTPPFLGGTGTGETMVFLLGIALTLGITEIVKNVKKSLGAKDQFGWFTNAVQDSLKKGWKGGELIPGLSITDTRKMPFGGLSGENITRKGAIAGAYPLGGVGSVIKNRAIGSPESSANAFTGGAEGASARVALLLGGDKQFLHALQEKLKKGKGSGGHP